VADAAIDSSCDSAHSNIVVMLLVAAVGCSQKATVVTVGGISGSLYTYGCVAVFKHAYTAD
jgi:hypothetical protein